MVAGVVRMAGRRNASISASRPTVARLMDIRMAVALKPTTSQLALGGNVAFVLAVSYRRFEPVRHVLV